MPKPVAPTKCTRCRQPLPAGSYFCIACGCNNEVALDERIVDIGNQIETRRWWLQLWVSLAEMFRWRHRL